MFILKRLLVPARKMTGIILAVLLLNVVYSMQHIVLAEPAPDQQLIFEFRNADGNTAATSLNAGQNYEMRVYFHNDTDISTVTLPMAFDKNVITLTGYSDGKAFTALNMEHLNAGSNITKYQLKSDSNTILPGSEINQNGAFVLNFTSVSPTFIDFDKIQDLSAINDLKHHFFTVKFKVNDNAGSNADPGFTGRITDLLNQTDLFWASDAMFPNKVHQNVEEPMDAPLHTQLLVNIIVPKDLTPTDTPTVEPTATPTDTPTLEPTATPTDTPTLEPTATPTDTPTVEPTAVPTDTPTIEPTAAPTDTPTVEPTAAPTDTPTLEPTAAPTDTPTVEPTAVPTDTPTVEPTAVPTDTPTVEPTAVPTDMPTVEPTAVPTDTPTAESTAVPTDIPTDAVTGLPTETPSYVETESPKATSTAKHVSTALLTDPPDNDHAVNTGERHGNQVILFGLILLSGSLLLLIAGSKKKYTKNI